MTEFFLRNNYFDFNGKANITSIGSNNRKTCTFTYACICMDEFENEFLSLRSDKPLVFLRMSMTFFLIWTHEEKELHKFIEDLNNHQPNINFTYTSSKNYFNFLDLDVQLSEGKITTNLHIKPTDRHQYLHFT